MIAHPLFDPETVDYDFALLRLQHPVTISGSVGIACLPPDGTDQFVGRTMTISGWGRSKFNGFRSSKLKAAFVIAESNQVGQFVIIL